MEICICFGIFCKLNLYEKKKREFTQYTIPTIPDVSGLGRSKNLKEQVEICTGILLPKLFWPSVRKKGSGD